jgi:hypothetical protein
MSDCRNDCRQPVLFPRPIFSRPGLPRIAYRIGTWSDFRAELLRRLDEDAVLAPWTYRGTDDPGIALIESASILGDILTFYQEVYANELYLGTAQLPQSVAGLVRLTGYRLSPGVGGNAVFAFTVTGAPVVIPARFPVTLDLAGLPDTAAFETTDPLTAYPALSRFALYRAFQILPVTAGTSVFALDTAVLTASGTTLEKGNRLMLVDSSGAANPPRQVAVIDKVEERFEQTEVTIKGAWQGPAVSALNAYRLSRSFRHFGYNAPPTKTTVNNGQAVQNPVDFTRSLSAAGSSFGSDNPNYSPVTDRKAFPLDSPVDDLAPGVTLLLSVDVLPDVIFTRQSAFGARSTFTAQLMNPGAITLLRPGGLFAARQITSTAKASLTLGSLTGASTVVTLDRSLSDGSISIDVRSVEIQEVTGGPFTLRAARTPTAGTTAELFFFGNGLDYQALDGRLIELERATPTPTQEAEVTQATAGIHTSAIGEVDLATLRPVSLSPAPDGFSIDEFPLAFPPDKPPVIVRGNLASATQGKTEKPVTLGNGDVRATFQTFPIPRTPLTYLISSSATPPETPQLVVTVDQLEWKQVPSLIASGPKDQVYIVREDSTGQSFVQFGDGETGARLPSGIGNVACTYRTGVGAFGPPKPGAEPSAGAALTGLDSVALREPASGGAQPETTAKALQTAPGKVQSLGRLVSLRDYETETLLVPGVSAASAAWEIQDGVPVIGLTVLMETGRGAEIEAVRELLAHYNVCRGPQRFPILVNPGRRVWVFIDAAVAMAPSYLEENVFPDVSAALVRLFEVSRGFGAPEYRSRIEGVIQEVPGVLWNTVTAFGSLGAADDPKTLQLPTPRPAADETEACSPDAILSLYPAHLTLHAVAAPTGGCE